MTADAGYHSPETLNYADGQGLDTYLPIQGVKASLARLREDLVFDEEEDVYRHPDGRVFAFDLIQRKQGKVYRVYRCGSNTFSRRLDSEKADRMRAKMHTDEGRAIFRLRRQTVEPVFGRMKEGLGLKRFRLRGLAGAVIEFALACMAHNLMKASKAVRLQAATA